MHSSVAPDYIVIVTCPVLAQDSPSEGIVKIGGGDVAYRHRGWYNELEAAPTAAAAAEKKKLYDTPVFGSVFA